MYTLCGKKQKKIIIHICRHKFKEFFGGTSLDYILGHLICILRDLIFFFFFFYFFGSHLVVFLVEESSNISG